MSESHKTEAELALKSAIAALGDGQPLEGLRRFQVLAAANYALEQIGLIQAVKRARRAAGAPPEAP